MIRRLDDNGDWVFGSGRGAFIGGLEGLKLRMATQLREWVGDCFFALKNGISWHMADKNPRRVLRECNTRLLQNPEVLGVRSVDIEKTANREWMPQIYAETIYGEARL